MLDPRPALTNGGEDHLSPGAVRDIAGGQVNGQQVAVGFDGDMALSADNLLGAIEGPFGARGRCLDRLAIENTAARTRTVGIARSVKPDARRTSSSMMACIFGYRVPKASVCSHNLGHTVRAISRNCRRSHSSAPARLTKLRLRFALLRFALLIFGLRHYGIAELGQSDRCNLLECWRGLEGL